MFFSTSNVSAIKDFSKEYYNRELKKIDQGDFILGFETGKKVSVVYIAKSISDELETKMRSLLMAFEFKFASKLEDKIVKTSQFESFKEMIFQTLSTEFIKNFYVPILTSQIENDDIPKLIPDSGWSIIAVIDGTLTVEEIAEKAEKDIRSTIEILALMRAQGLVEGGGRRNPSPRPSSASAGPPYTSPPDSQVPSVAYSLTT